MNRRNVVFVLCAVLGLLADQVSKAWIVANVEYLTGRIEIIPGFFEIVHARNPGAAFGLLGDFPLRLPIFFVFTLVAAWVIWDMFRKTPPDDAYMAAALGLLTSGAAGNAIDRVRQQYVTDFIRVYVEDVFDYPSFNIADAALVIGVIMLVVHWLFLDESRRGQKKDEPATPSSSQETSETTETTETTESPDPASDDAKDDERTPSESATRA